MAADALEYVATGLASLEPWWCGHPALREALDAYRESLERWDDRNRLLRQVMGDKAFARHAKAVEDAALAHGIALEQGVILRAYSDREHYFGIDDDIVPLYIAMNTLGRLMVDLDAPLPFPEGQLYRIGVMILLMDEALSALPPVPGTYWRGVSLSGMSEPLRQRWKDAHRKGRVVQYNGYTSVTAIEGRQYGGEHQFQMHLENPRDMRPFAVDPGEGEFLLPRGVQLEYRGIQDGYRVMGERLDRKDVKKARNFVADEDEIEAWINMGYTRERAIEILQEMKDTRERSRPITEEEQRWWKNMYERMQAEATAGLKE